MLNELPGNTKLPVLLKVQVYESDISLTLTLEPLTALADMLFAEILLAETLPEVKRFPPVITAIALTSKPIVRFHKWFKRLTIWRQK